MPSNELELEAISQRGSLIPLNIYNSSNQNQKYGSGHPNAISDGDNKGKGTNQYLDTTNGGGDFDINGNPAIAGSGRIPNIATNQYNKTNIYETPDTSGNVGQVII